MRGLQAGSAMRKSPNGLGRINFRLVTAESNVCLRKSQAKVVYLAMSACYESGQVMRGEEWVQECGYPGQQTTFLLFMGAG